MRAIGNFTLVKAAGAGFALTALNPKNVLLVVGAAVEIAGFGLPAGQEIAVLGVFVLVASAGVLTPLILSLALGERSRELLDGMRTWMGRHNAVIMAALLLLIGAKLIGDAISGLSN
jgi:threonine/homoserine/homoserine lactone efflux protein